MPRRLVKHSSVVDSHGYQQIETRRHMLDMSGTNQHDGSLGGKERGSVPILEELQCSPSLLGTGLQFLQPFNADSHLGTLQ